MPIAIDMGPATGTAAEAFSTNSRTNGTSTMMSYAPVCVLAIPTTVFHINAGLEKSMFRKRARANAMEKTRTAVIGITDRLAATMLQNCANQ